MTIKGKTTGASVPFLVSGCQGVRQGNAFAPYCFPSTLKHAAVNVRIKRLLVYELALKMPDAHELEKHLADAERFADVQSCFTAISPR